MLRIFFTTFTKLLIILMKKLFLWITLTIVKVSSFSRWAILIVFNKINGIFEVRSADDWNGRLWQSSGNCRIHCAHYSKWGVKTEIGSDYQMIGHNIYLHEMYITKIELVYWCLILLFFHFSEFSKFGIGPFVTRGFGTSSRSEMFSIYIY